VLKWLPRSDARSNMPSTCQTETSPGIFNVPTGPLEAEHLACEYRGSTPDDADGVAHEDHAEDEEQHAHYGCVVVDHPLFGVVK